MVIILFDCGHNDCYEQGRGRWRGAMYLARCVNVPRIPARTSSHVTIWEYHGPGQYTGRPKRKLEHSERIVFSEIGVTRVLGTLLY